MELLILLFGRLLQMKLRLFKLKLMDNLNLVSGGLIVVLLLLKLAQLLQMLLKKNLLL